MKLSSFMSYRSLLMVGTAMMVVTSSGCQLAENYTKADRSGNMEIQDYRDALAPRELPTKASKESQDPSIPSLQSYVSDKDVAKSAPMPLVSISINQSIPLRDALFELAKQADFDIELDPRIRGSVIYTARNRPFDEVIDRISAIAGLRSEFKGNAVKIELDTPFSETYRVDFLPLKRNSKSSISTSVSVGGSSDAGSTGGGSNFGVESSTETDFWKDLEDGIKQIVAANQSSGVLKTKSDPALSLSDSASSGSGSSSPPVPPIDPSALGAEPQAGDENTISFKNVFTGGQMVTDTAAATAAASAATAAATAAAAGSAADASKASSDAKESDSAKDSSKEATPAPSTPSPTSTVLKVESLPTSSSGSGEEEATIESTYSINKSAGIVTVFAPQSVQRKVADYLEQVKKSMSQQVLIEAKVLEVQLNDEYANGIDWSIVSSKLGNLKSIGFSGAGTLSPTEAATSGFVYNGGGLDLVVSAIARFGNVKALASPRVTVLNNQSAVLNVAQNQVYFKIDVTKTEATTTAPASFDYSTEQRTVPEGVLINVLPTIDSETGQISMQVRPTISKIVSWTEDPTPALLGSDAKSLVPNVSVKELDTVVQLKDGDAIVMGGLMEDTSSGTQRGVPVAGEVPILGNLFKAQQNTIHKSEFVIFLKSTILADPSDSIGNTDRDIYRTFGQDRRPLKM